MDHIEWLKERQTGIGGSDAAAILGVDPYRTALDLWREKTGEVRQIETTPAMRRGIVLEPIAAELYVEKTGRAVRRQPMRRHPDFDWMIGNVDRQILVSTLPIGNMVSDVESTGVLEIKCPGLRVLANVKAHGLPNHMTVQLMHYLGVYGYEWGSFCLFNAENWDLIWFDLEADQEFIGSLIEREQEFWTKCVIPRIPPPETMDAKTLEVPEVEGEVTVVTGAEWREAATNLREARDLKQAAEDLESHEIERLKALMHREEIHAAEVPGIARLYYKPYPGNTQWKPTAEALAREAKLDLEQLIVRGKPHTRFTPYFLNGQED